MLKRFFVAVLAIASLLVAVSAEAQQRRAAPVRAPHQEGNMWTYSCMGKGTPRVADGTGSGDCRCPKVPTVGLTCDQFMTGNMSPMPPAPVTTPSAPAPVAPAPAPTQTTGSCPYGNYNPADCDELRKQYEAEKAAQANRVIASITAPRAPAPAPVPVAAPAPQAAPVVTSVAAGCWVKNPLSKTMLVDLMQMNTSAGAWYTNMCLTPEDWVRSFERMQDWNNASSVSKFATSFSQLVERDCTDNALKNLAFVSPSGQKSPAGKCVENEVLLYDGNGAVFALVAGKPLVAKDAIIRKP